MECTRKGLAVLVVGCLAFAGCGPSYTYRYSPPPSAHGMNCIENCSTQRSHCRQMARLQERNERALYDADMRAYQYCQSGKSKKEARRSCYYPSYPFRMGDGYYCEADYDSCYTTCGGTIHRTLNKD